MQITHFSFLLLFLLFFQCSLAQESALTAGLKQMPPCALSCLTVAIGESSCQPTNVTCVCTDRKLLESVQHCVAATCTIKEALRTQNATQTTCGAPVRSQVTTVRVTNIVLGSISAVCVILRTVYMIFWSAAEIGWDDFLIIAVLIVGVPQTIITDRGTTANGLGRDIWTVPPENITTFLRYFFVMEVLYFFILMLLKLTLLFFFLRIFPARKMRHIIWATITFTLLWGMACIIAAIFQCNPISFSWDRWDGEHKGQCVDINALGWSNAAISIVLDVWMLALPLYQVFQLKLSWKKKISVTLMFCVGTFVTVMSILRLQSLIHFGNSLNPTWDQSDASQWSTIEINVGIVCACLPALRKILIRFFPSIQGSTARNTSQYQAKYGNGYAPGGPVSGVSGNKSNAVGSRLGSSDAAGVLGRSGIAYTKTFEVHHTDNDEEQLVRMDDLSGKGFKTKSSNSSDISASGVITPLPNQERRGN